ncbi:hypothetical protein LVD17_15025 [Fulvivirga ulvae]|nr:hypothetical protein [Fulvivirga ulvae]UII29611.1 hypothetical protein LVD17_15025 [Fulvivirga ulvae]
MANIAIVLPEDKDTTSSMHRNTSKKYSSELILGKKTVVNYFQDEESAKD